MRSNSPVGLSSELYKAKARSDGGSHGVVLTKPHVVELILDLAGYRPSRNLASRRLLEPSCGKGAFLVPAVRRLCQAARRQRVPLASLSNAVLAFDVDPDHVAASRREVARELEAQGADVRTAHRLAEQWVKRADFLLEPLEADFDFVVGNPPYVRIEHLSRALQAEYRKRYVTLFDRADLYVAFIERSLSVLAKQGVLSYVCADRWTLNRYGAPLRRLVSSRYAVLAYIEMHNASPFESDVIAYPSIFVLQNGPSASPVRVTSMREATASECRAVSDAHVRRSTGAKVHSTAEYSRWFSSDEPWTISSPKNLDVLRGLEARFPLLEDHPGTSVRIGIATGNDSVYIVPATLDIEPDRLAPLVMRDDLQDGKIVKSGRAVINTFDSDGVVDLGRYPKLAAYLEQRSAVLRRRHVASKNPKKWFRTIDRLHPDLVRQPKLLVPDIAGANEVVLDSGHYYPHHNLYFILSESWDLEVLGGLLSSRVALFFVWSYAVKMRGGYLRFQAQYLRRIRVPDPASIDGRLKSRIRTAFRRRDFRALDELAASAYALDDGPPTFPFVDTRSGVSC